MTSSAHSLTGIDSRTRAYAENPTRPSALHHTDRTTPRTHEPAPVREHAAARRPSDRRALIIRAAGELMYENGFQNVSMGMIAKAVGVGPSALYRHFDSKNALLGAVLYASFEEQKNVLQRMVSALPKAVSVSVSVSVRAEQTESVQDSIEHVVRYAAEMSLLNRRAGVLWQQNSHYLPEVDLTLLRARLRNMLISYGELLRHRRPELTSLQAEFLAVASLATHTSLSFHHQPIDPDGVIELLVGWAMTVADLPLPVDSRQPADPGAFLTSPAPTDFETVLQQAAVSLLADNGHWPGRSVLTPGIAGVQRSDYNHFAAKTPIIRTAVISGFNRLQLELSRAGRDNAAPAETLERIFFSYIDRMLAEPYLINIVICEVPKLAPAARDQARRTQSRYVAEWVTLALAANPTWDEKRARLTVTAFMSVVNDVVRSPRPRSMPGVREALAGLGRALLVPGTQG